MVEMSKAGLVAELVLVFQDSISQKSDERVCAAERLGPNAELRDIEQLSENPFEIPLAQKGDVFVVALAWALKYGQAAVATYFVHNLFWQIFEDDIAPAFTHFRQADRTTIWRAIQNVYDDVLDLREDPYWIAERPAVKRRILNTDGTVSGGQQAR